MSPRLRKGASFLLENEEALLTSHSESTKISTRNVGRAGSVAEAVWRQNRHQTEYRLTTEGDER